MSPSAPAAAAGLEAGECCSPPASRPPLDAEAAATLAARFKALADPNRLRLLSLVAAGEDAEACVCDLTEPLGLGQPTVSHHLRILVDAGFLTREKRGVWAYYSVVPEALADVAARLTGPLGSAR
ncbi:metalloregulator ArsR/SmtB family transcription factor [Zhihengliuella sp.]|uniref:ArsR/SmtB family transcription factor n=1 Tax=Zhihengliuella sp. TaxID=1954483 RepID=UPI002810A2EA|nr:metalloregulator ArsR/SmtB family transcription factor [Zhihengliuella sp.]